MVGLTFLGRPTWSVLKDLLQEALASIGRSGRSVIRHGTYRILLISKIMCTTLSPVRRPSTFLLQVSENVHVSLF